jgi:hypothetical protein
VFSLLSHGNSGKDSGNHGAKRHVVIFWFAIAEHFLNFNYIQKLELLHHETYKLVGSQISCVCVRALCPARVGFSAHPFVHSATWPRWQRDNACAGREARDFSRSCERCCGRVG